MISRSARLALVSFVLFGAFVACGGGGAAPPGVSTACNAAFAANDDPNLGGKSDHLLAVTFTACSTYADWKAGWLAHPHAHGSAVDPDIFSSGACSGPDGALGDIRNTPVCVDRAAKGIQPPA